MLTFEQIKAIENALGPDKAKPIVEAIQTTDTRVMTSLLAEVATKEDIAKLRGEMREENAKLRAETREENVKLRAEMREEIANLRGDFKRLEVMIKVLIGLAIMAIACFSPNLAALVRLAK